ncbi:HD-GYP domain-containing protein [Streptomyces sp. Rer75]|uniref:HD-GYP domain-containing protein n=1 Tax=Streptomyces sp. Rer75 TaxID=2750011 RepID=UPI00211F1641|nr:HD domain-containing protein [Streptomyces sp. Rer75]
MRAGGPPPVRRRGGRVTLGAVYGAAGALAVVALAWTEWHGIREPGAALAFGLLIALGEAIRCCDAPAALPRASGAHEQRGEPTPLAAAGALGYALLGRLGGEPTNHGVLQVVTVVVAASLTGLVPRMALGRPADPGHTARRVLTVGFAATCFQPLHHTGRLASWLGHGPALVGYLLGVLALTALCDAVLAAALARARTGWPYGPLLRDELRALTGIGAAICATGVVMALTVAVTGLWALPVLALPPLLIQYSFRRYAAIRATCRQTIASLARSTEIAGYTPAGHARKVAGLSRAVGRELGLSEPALTVLEYAALMHDIGQLSLVDPVPAGATEPLTRAEQRRIALLGGAVVRQTGVPAEVAVIVERQADPYREQPLSARIVRAVNAYTEAAGGPAAAEQGGAAPLCALERLRLATARDFDPAVVEALATVLSRPAYDRPR